MSTATCAAPALPTSLVSRPKQVKSRAIEKPPEHGEKPFLQLVDEAFDGSPCLRLSNRLRLLEEASTRHIRRGDALDAIAAAQRKFERQHAVKPRTPSARFLAHFAAFALAYLAIALGWFTVMALR